MSAYEDEDGIDGPWNKAMARATAEDAARSSRRQKREAISASRVAVAQKLMRELTLDLERANAAARRMDLMPQQCGYDITARDRCRETALPGRKNCRFHGQAGS